MEKNQFFFHVQAYAFDPISEKHPLPASSASSEKPRRDTLAEQNYIFSSVDGSCPAMVNFDYVLPCGSSQEVGRKCIETVPIIDLGG